MPRVLHRTGRWTALHPWRAIGAWLLDLLREHVPGAGNHPVPRLFEDGRPTA